jgi:transcription elongation factor Elf1
MDRFNSFDDEDEGTPKRGRGKSGEGGKNRHTEFECPECNANNPVADGYGVGSEVQCFYCGMEFKVSDSNGRFKFKPV